MKRVAAFSLIEVLVAFALLATALIVVVPELAKPAAQIDQRTARAYAADYARSRLARYGTVDPIAGGRREGEDFGWQWQESVSRERVGEADVFKIEITVFDPSGRTKLASGIGYR